MVRAAGGLVIADEVQAGYGRTGGWWGYDDTGFTPDIVVTGSRWATACRWRRRRRAGRWSTAFAPAPATSNTFASSPLQAAVGMAVLDVIVRDGLIANVAAVGGALKQALAEAQAALGRHRRRAWPRPSSSGVEIIKDGEAKTPDPATAAELSNRLKDRGFLTGRRPAPTAMC